MYSVDVDKLNGKIAECRLTQEGLALELGIDRGTLRRRLNGNTLRIGDVHKICEVLNLTNEEALIIFLHKELQ